MSSNPLTEAGPRWRAPVLCATLLAFCSMMGVAEASAAPRNVQHSGELNYTKFRSAAARGETVTIRYSPGGTGASALALARIPKVVVDGVCNSACAWSFVKSRNACFTSRASFGFHAAHDPGTGRRLNAATSYWLQSVRPSLKGRLNGLLSTSRLIRVSAAEMRRHYGDRACGARPKVQAASLDAPLRKPKRGAKPSPAASASVPAADDRRRWITTGRVSVLEPELVAAVDILATARQVQPHGVPVDPEGALATLLASAHHAGTNATWDGMAVPRLFAGAERAIMRTAARAAGEDPQPRQSLSLLYRPRINLA